MVVVWNCVKNFMRLLAPFQGWAEIRCKIGGWFNKEINSLEDLKGLKMRITGLGVLERAGRTPVQLPGGEIFTVLQTGTIDATNLGRYDPFACQRP